TGLVSISADRKTATVTLECFDKDDLTLRQIARCTTAVDRDVVADLGLSYVVNAKGREAMVARRSRADVDRHVSESLRNDVRPKDVAGVEVTLLADGKAVELKAAQGGGDQGPRFVLPCPPRDSAVTVRLRNTTDKVMT